MNLPEKDAKGFVHRIWLKIYIDGRVDEDLEIDEATYLKISKLLPEDDPV